MPNLIYTNFDEIGSGEIRMLEKPVLISGRIGFGSIDEIEERIQNVDFPIELALPHRYDWWNLRGKAGG